MLAWSIGAGVRHQIGLLQQQQQRKVESGGADGELEVLNAAVAALDLTAGSEDGGGAMADGGVKGRGKGGKAKAAKPKGGSKAVVDVTDADVEEAP